jgi:hypothetical protein
MHYYAESKSIVMRARLPWSADFLTASPAASRFALTGASARKRKRGSVSLLAGRAFVYHFFPVTSTELGDGFDLTKAMHSGTNTE